MQITNQTDKRIKISNKEEYLLLEPTQTGHLFDEKSPIDIREI